MAMSLHCAEPAALFLLFCRKLSATDRSFPQESSIAGGRANERTAGKQLISAQPSTAVTKTDILL
jgi:hypothetical protein